MFGGETVRVIAPRCWKPSVYFWDGHAALVNANGTVSKFIATTAKPAVEKLLGCNFYVIFTPAAWAIRITLAAARA